MARRKRYSAEFKRQALRRANEPGVTDALVCEELGISTRQLRRWRDSVKEHGEAQAFPGQGKGREEELTRLRRELRLLIRRVSCRRSSCRSPGSCSDSLYPIGDGLTRFVVPNARLVVRSPKWR